MKVNKRELQDALTIVEPGLANKEVIEQTTSFAFVKGRVVTYNDEISMSYPVKGLHLTGAVKADKLYALLKKIKLKKDKEGKVDENIDITLGEAEIEISYYSMKAGLALQSDIKLPLDQEIAEKGEWKALPEDFMPAIKFTMTCCSRDMSRPVLTCIHINKDGFIEASDSYRLARFELLEDLPVKTFLLPATSATELVKFEPVEIALGKGWIHFKTADDGILSCRILADAFPDTSPIRKETEGKSIEIKLPNTIESMLERAKVFAKKDHVLDEIIQVTLEDRKFRINVKSDTDWFEEAVNINYEGTKITFAVTPYLLKDIISETKSCTLASNKLRFTGDHWVYITMLRA